MSVHTLVAHFLKENGYTQTLAAFEKEHGTLLDLALPHGESLEEIIADRQVYQAPPPPAVDESVQERKARHFKNWSVPFPNHPKSIAAPLQLVVDCAFLEGDRKTEGGESGSDVLGSKDETASAAYALLALSNKSLLVANLKTGKVEFEVKNPIGSVIRRVLVHDNRIFLCGMDGKLTVGILDLGSRRFHCQLHKQLHARLISDLKIVVWRSNTYIISMGWDFMVRVFLVGETVELKAELKLSNQGSCMDVVVHNDKVYILVCKKEITLMDVICFEERLEVKFRIALNEAEFSAVGFTPMAISVFGGDTPLVAIATSHEPFMRVLVVALDDKNGNGDGIRRQQIITNLSTSSPQDKFSEAKIQWREDGSGLWIAGEDGNVRGLDLLAEKVVVCLEAHDGRMKSVCFWKGVFMTCGIDKTIKFWE